MSNTFSLALAVKELEAGEFHWILLEETASSDDLLSYVPQHFSEPHRDAAAAWSAGYLAIRARMRKGRK
jgi:hypothetical protein